MGGAFDPSRHMIQLKGKDYLTVAWRLVWFREDHPGWGIVTTPVEINMEKQYAIFSCQIFDDAGKLVATATKMENIRGFGDFLEKAETGSVGRALAYCGYGTQFAPDLEEGTERILDTPVDRTDQSGQARPNGQGNNTGNGNRGNTGNYGAARPQRQAAGPSAAAASSPSSGSAICHCGQSVAPGRAAYCNSKGRPITCQGQCEQMVPQEGHR